jgi:hypothetical protein
MGNTDSQPCETQKTEDIELAFAKKYVHAVAQLNYKQTIMPIINYNHYLMYLSDDCDTFYFEEQAKYLVVPICNNAFDKTMDGIINSIGRTLMVDTPKTHSRNLAKKVVRRFIKLVEHHNLPIIRQTDKFITYNMHISCVKLNMLVKSVAEQEIQRLEQYTPNSITNTKQEISAIDAKIQEKRNEIAKQTLSITKMQDLLDECILLQTHKTNLEKIVNKYNAKYISSTIINTKIRRLNHFISKLCVENNADEVANEKCSLPVKDGLIHLPTVPVAIPITNEVAHFNVVYPNVPTNEITVTATVEMPVIVASQTY